MTAATAEKNANPLVVFKHQLDQREEQFKAVLPAHIPAERFMRVVLTAVQNSPGFLQKVDRQSLFNSAIRAAQDGLLPDGREGAIVEFAGKAQWMPMIAGLRKKVRNSGEIATWEAHVVFEEDAFEFELGDEPFIRHRPSTGDRGKPIGAYSIATLKTGEKSREFMSIKEIEKVRNVSRAKDSATGPWKNWFEEMCRKTVARRHSKVLPMSTDLDDLIRRDDDLYDMEGARKAAEAGSGPQSLAGKLHMLARPAVEQVPIEPIEAGANEGDATDQPSAAQPDKPAAETTGAPAPQPAPADIPADTPKSEVNYETVLVTLDGDLTKAATLEELDDVAEKAREDWMGDAPKAIFKRGSAIYVRHRERVSGAAQAGGR